MKTGCARSSFRHRILPVILLGMFIALLLPGKVSASTSYTGKKPADAELNKEYSYETVLDANGGMFTLYDEWYDTYESATYDALFAWTWTSDESLGVYRDYTLPERDGYELVGWSRSKGVSVPDWDCDFNGMISPDSNVKKYPEKLYAVWAKVYEITLNANGGGAFGYETIGGNSFYIDTKTVGFYYDPLKKTVNCTDKMKPWPWSKEEDKVLAGWSAGWDNRFGPELEDLILNESTPEELFAEWEYKDLKDVRVYQLSDKAYTGKPVIQDLEVCTPQYLITLKEGTDYTVSYQDNVNAGTATVIIRGIGRYTGSTSRTFKIYKTAEPKATAIGKASASVIKNQTYTGKALKPTVKLTFGGKTLTAGTDYTLHYKANKAVGTATVTVTGIDNFTGTKKLTFQIIKAANPMTVKGKTATIKYSAVKKKAQTIAAKNAFTVSKAQGKVTHKKSGGNKSITISSAGKFTVKKGLKKGTYPIKVKVSAAGNANYKASSKTVTVKVRVK